MMQLVFARSSWSWNSSWSNPGTSAPVLGAICWIAGAPANEARVDASGRVGGGGRGHDQQDRRGGRQVAWDGVCRGNLVGCWVETGRADGGGPTAGAIDHRMDAGVSGCVRSPGPCSWCPAAVPPGPVVMALGRAQAGRTDAVSGLDGPDLGRVRAGGEDGVQG